MSDLTINNIEEQIKKHKAELAKLEGQLEVAKAESPDQQLARELHGMACTMNHTDGCGWYYEFKNKQDDWTGRVHGEYLAKARNLTAYCEQHNCTVETAVSFYKLIKGI